MRQLYACTVSLSCFLQLISSAFLGYGIFHIRRQANESKTHKFDVTQSIALITAFGAYLAADLYMGVVYL